eukprot:CAMPEP_0172772612 /NCGR_PEP_ID=MMETSP1074-20121228/192695_1 /TAXON_ID=2916 /ORGANISM="Ceratium fusus, Strain PA161109" /LENGTH=149 /DNA_ID=CAMNT_0013608763 /DNA_START=107 /DNA_END=556 /DNA_ORIENTATION=+
MTLLWAYGSRQLRQTHFQRMRQICHRVSVDSAVAATGPDDTCGVGLRPCCYRQLKCRRSIAVAIVAVNLLEAGTQTDAATVPPPNHMDFVHDVGMDIIDAERIAAKQLAEECYDRIDEAILESTCFFQAATRRCHFVKTVGSYLELCAG